jgi:hypothetical protein
MKFHWLELQKNQAEGFVQRFGEKTCDYVTIVSNCIVDNCMVLYLHTVD